MKEVDCELIDKDGYCHHPDMCCPQECGVILDGVCGMRPIDKGKHHIKEE